MGPFELDASRVEGLRTVFTHFVNRLLQLECAVADLDGYKLAITHKETVGDGGVDAALRGARRTEWLPGGDSAWQFKRSARGWGPKALAKELEGATWVHEYIRSGGSYVIVLGSALNDQLLEGRRKAVAAKAVALNLITADDRDRIRLYDANALARWASTFLPLCVAPEFGGPGAVAVDFSYWSDVQGHKSIWVPDKAREQLAETIRENVRQDGFVDIRVQGEAGAGKTRVTLEALRDPGLSPLVAYVSQEDQFTLEAAVYVSDRLRTVILVVDECDPDRHAKVLERLSKSQLKVITIGLPGAVPGRRILRVEALKAIEEFLKTNYKQLSAEQRRFVETHCFGNPRWAIIMADTVLNTDATEAADIITRNDIEQFVTKLLPEGRDCLLAALLALVERVGWERELTAQVEALAAFAGVSVDELRLVGEQLGVNGFLTKQGRYRAVAPLPLAVFLAAAYWKNNANRIIDDLLPTLEEEMSLSLFRRAAELGRFEPARAVLPPLLSADGPFESLEVIEEAGRGRQLTQLAIVLPKEVAEHLAELVEDHTLDELREMRGVRRDLVWTLEKLVWHTFTFETAADTLLKLALAENETYANNATGTWLDLFGTMLPGTAAKPAQRTAYLQRWAGSDDIRVRELAARACSKALVPTQLESIVVSGELQGGAVVEERGKPATWDEAAEYWRSAIELLRRLATDRDKTVRTTAEDSLVAAAHAWLGDTLIGEPLKEALLGLEGDGRRKVRETVEHLQNLYQRHPVEGREMLQAALASLAAALPPMPADEEVAYLLEAKRWDLGEDVLKERMLRAMTGLSKLGRDKLLTELARRQVNAAWEAGYALSQNQSLREETLPKVVAAAKANFPALMGFLQALVDGGEPDAFTSFLEGQKSAPLTTAEKLSAAVRAPDPSVMHGLVRGYLRELSVADGTNLSYVWQRYVTEEELADYLSDWLPRIRSEEDYSALVSWVSRWMSAHEVNPELKGRVWQVLQGADTFPDTVQASWEWTQLAEKFVRDRPVEIAHLLLSAVESGRAMVYASTPAGDLLQHAAAANPEAIFADVMSRIGRGSWQVQMAVRGWLVASVPVATIDEWVGESNERGRQVAGMANARGAEPTPVARILLNRWPDDDEIGALLAGDFVSGSWTGPYSVRLGAARK